MSFANPRLGRIECALALAAVVRDLRREVFMAVASNARFSLHRPASQSNVLSIDDSTIQRFN
ncbi:MAG: hypothetical protein DME87_13500 [Verrucomicrobia bacterium]|nr:MAG: hypothetical protein DME87_13500 [Verrucomicrobiota bacterium]